MFQRVQRLLIPVCLAIDTTERNGGRSSATVLGQVPVEGSYQEPFCGRVILALVGGYAIHQLFLCGWHGSRNTRAVTLNATRKLKPIPPTLWLSGRFHSTERTIPPARNTTAR